ncbi:DNA polymerase V family [Striga asiatica]|uniref:DNA polymerase V family n=1 Tax=Striga asiatica TaxID=4170 RepID=A0A5A7RD20_STRAF|nr:DNA polymerase V family [Striga asiatica]
MGSKKRESNSIEEAGLENVVENKQPASLGDENIDSEPSSKRIKKEKKKKETENLEGENHKDANAASTSSNAHKVSLNSMERRKLRKLLDKERHQAEAKKIQSAPEKMDLDVKSDGNESAGTSNSSGGGVLPEFHIGVFKDLAAVDTSVREAAAKALVTELREVQNAYERLENKDEVEDKSKLEAEKCDGLNNCAPSVRYAVRRLIRGVSSSRECARQGFALGLTVLVGTVPSIKLDSLLKLIDTLLEVTSSMKGQEAKDCLLGRLFAYGALARSGKLTEEWNSDNNTPLIKEFTSYVIALAAKKRYLQESGVAVILEMVGKLPIEAILSHVLEVPGIQQWFEGATEPGNPDALLLALKLQEKIGADYNCGKLLPSPYSKSAFFSADHLTIIANCLKESTFCQPRLHSVWAVLVSNLLPDVAQDADSGSGNTVPIKKHKKSRRSGSAEEDIERNLRSFCEVIIEGSLLPSSHDRKKLAFDVLLLLLPKLPASCVHIVLSYKLVQCLTDILSTQDSWLYKIAQHFLKELSEWVAQDDVRRVEVIVALQKNSNGKFDCITRSKTVKDLMSDFKTESGCMLFVENLMSMFLDEGHSSEEPSDQSQTTDDNSEIGSIEDKDAVGVQGSSEFLKTWVIESLPSVPKHLKLDQDSRFHVQKEVLKFLAVQGLFSSSLGTEVTSFELQEKFRWPKSAIPNALSQMCVEQLQLLLANAQKGEGPHAVANGVEANDLGSYFMRVLNILSNIPSVSLSRALSVDDEKAFKKLQAMESQLSREERNCGLSMDASKLHALRYLLIQLLLQIILRPGEFFEAASELVMCCKKAFGSSDLLGSSEEDEYDEGAPELMDVLVDTMLSLLPQSSAPLRSAIELVFKHFCNNITDDGLLRMLRVIKKDLKPARHQNKEDEDDDDEDDLLGVEEAEDSDQAETGETDEHTDDSEAVVGVDTANIQLPEGSDDESDEGMDDDAMFRMDTYLARIFREKKNQAGGETAHSQLVLFKLRVLSLLEIYLHENPGKDNFVFSHVALLILFVTVVTIFSNLAQAFANPQTTEGSEQLGQRIWGIIQKKIFKAKDYPRGDSVHLAVIEPLLERYLKLAAKPFKRKKSASNLSKKKQSASWNRHRMINSLAQNSTYWILKLIDSRNFSEPELQKVCSIFQNALVAYFDSKKSQMKCEFLKEIFRRRPWIGRHLFGFLLEKCSCAKSKFRQVEALDLILSSFNMASNFLKALEADGHAACESQLGEVFIAFKKHE